MTFLQMCNRLISLAGIPGGDITTVVGQTGELGRIVNYISDGWVEIQKSNDLFKFLRVEDAFTFPTVAGQSVYTLSDLSVDTVMNNWIRDSFRSFTTGDLGSEYPVPYRSYDAWKNSYLIGGTRDTRTRPTEMSIEPSSRSICLGPVPSAGWTISGDYNKLPVVLAANGDTPVIQSHHHMIIVYWGLREYGYFESAPDAIAYGQNKFEPMMRELTSEWAPQMTMGGPIA